MALIAIASTDAFHLKKKLPSLNLIPGLIKPGNVSVPEVVTEKPAEVPPTVYLVPVRPAPVQYSIPNYQQVPVVYNGNGVGQLPSAISHQQVVRYN